MLIHPSRPDGHIRRLMLQMSVFVVGLLAASGAHAITLTEIINNIKDPVTASEGLIAAVSYITGAVFLFIAFINIKNMAGQQSREPGKIAIIATCLIAGAGLMYFPSTIETSGETIFGGAEQTQGADGGTGLIQ